MQCRFSVRGPLQEWLSVTVWLRQTTAVVWRSVGLIERVTGLRRTTARVGEKKPDWAREVEAATPTASGSPGCTKALSTRRSSRHAQMPWRTALLVNHGSPNIVVGTAPIECKQERCTAVLSYAPPSSGSSDLIASFPSDPRDASVPLTPRAPGFPGGSLSRFPKRSDLFPSPFVPPLPSSPPTPN